MSNPSNLGALLYADESTFGEVSTTYDERLAILNPTTEMAAGLEHSLIAPTWTKQYQNDGDIGIRGIYGGAFSIEGWLTGHGSTAAGAISATALETFLGRVVGNLSVAQAGTTVNVATSASQFSLVGGTVLAGGMIRVGSLNDARGNGQFAVVNNASTITLHTALDATPNAADVVYAAAMVYPYEDPTVVTPTSLRFNILTANQRYGCWGCYPTGIAFSGLNPGELPRFSVPIAVSRWAAESGSTFPTATAQLTDTPAPVAAGSFFYQTVSQSGTITVTRQKLTILSCEISIDMPTVAVTGPGATDARQAVIAARRLGCRMRMTVTYEAAAAGTDVFGAIFDTAEATRNFYHLLYSASCEDGTALGFYLPRATLVDRKPVQQDGSGRNIQSVTFEGTSGPTTTNDLTQSNWRMALA